MFKSTDAEAKPKGWFNQRRASFLSTTNLNSYISARKTSAPTVSSPIDRPTLTKSHSAYGINSVQASIYNSGVTSDSITYPIDTDLRTCPLVSVALGAVQCKIPAMVYKCCQFLESSEKVDGLFRVNGSVKKVRLIEARLGSDLELFEFDDYGKENEPVTAYDVSMLLKRYLSHLSHSIITKQASEKLKVYEESCLDRDMDKYAEILVQEIPTIHIHIMLYILKFLSTLADPEIVTVTRMTTANLAKIFQLSFFKFEINGNMSTEDLMGSYRVFEDLLQRWIENYDAFFGSVSKCLETAEYIEPLERVVTPTELPTPTSIYTTAPHNSSVTSLDSQLTVPKQRKLKSSQRKRMSLAFLDSTRSMSTSILEDEPITVYKSETTRAVSDPSPDSIPRSLDEDLAEAKLAQNTNTTDTQDPQVDKQRKVKLARRLSVRFGLSKMTA